MIKQKSILSFILAFVMCLGLAVPAWAAEKVTEEAVLQAMDQYIDEDIFGTEREVMREVLASLDPEDRENVVYIKEDGTIYATSEELKDEWVFYELNEDGNYENASGEEIVSPFVDEMVTAESIAGDLENYMQNMIHPMIAEGGEGPYRRVGSNTGYSWMSGYLTLPPNSNVYVPNGGVTQKEDPVNFQKDVPYAYFGGSCLSGKEIDAGMMYNGGRKNWSLFITAGGGVIKNDSLRFNSDQKIFLKCYVSANGKVTALAEGTVEGKTGIQQRTVTAEDAEERNTSGTNCSLKHVVSIAQGEYENFKSGSYFKGVKWSDIRIGTSSTKNYAWTAAYGANIINYPANKQGMTISYTNPGNETVSIDLN